MTHLLAIGEPYQASILMSRSALGNSNVLHYKVRYTIGLKSFKTSSYWRVLHLMKLKQYKSALLICIYY